MEPQWERYGVEPALVAADIAENSFHAHVCRDTLRNAAFEEAVFDVITVLDALFFMPNPLNELLEIHRILKADGLLAVEIPGRAYSRVRNWSAITCLFDGLPSARKLLYSNHLFFFSAKTLVSLLRKAGFEVVAKHPEQASLARGGALRALNEIHFAIARALHKATAGRLSIAGKEFYIARKR
jgi:SAM-dependent methyltransferase